MREFDTGATRDTDEDKYDYEGHLCPLALERYAAYMHVHRKQADGKIRDSDNWQKGLPIKECIKSMIRHVLDIWKLNRGYAVIDRKTDNYISMEEALCANIFNAFSILSTKQKEKLQIPENTPQDIDPTKQAEQIRRALYKGTCAPSAPNSLTQLGSAPLQYGGG